jgi:hypothetical protein
VAHLCIQHPHEHAEGLCRKCGAPYCADCLVYPFGPAKPPFCIPCAVNAGGVRTTAGSPRLAQPKETKQRLKEWRKARKRDLNSPPPDGVATWQKMDEAAAEDAEEAAQAKAEAERDALRLPPPQPETPTPPPGVNLAPPGPPGEDWRDEIDVNFGPPGSSADSGPLLGYAPPDDQPLPDLGPAPVPEAESIGIDIGFGSPDGFEPTPLAGFADPTPEAPSPYDTGTSFGLGPISDEPAASAPYTLPVDEAPATAQPPPYDPPAYEPVGVEAPSFPPVSFDPPAAESAGFEPPAFEPVGFDPPAGFDPSAFDPPPAAPPGFEPPPFEPVTFDAPTSAPTPFEPTPFEPAAAAVAPVAFESPADPLAASFGTAMPEPTGAAPTYPPAGLATEPLASFGLGAETDFPAPLADDPLPPPPVVDAMPATRAAAPPASVPEPAMPAPIGATLSDIPPPAIRPATPTRIPAAAPDAPKSGDAKAMLARIAALREKD